MSADQLVDALLTNKPYFGPAMRAMQGPPDRHRCLSAIVEAFATSKPEGSISILEVGSWAGASAVTWAKAIQKTGRDGHVTCVDQWQPYFSEELDTAPVYHEMNEAAAQDKILNLFLHNVRTSGVAHLVKHLRGDARKILPDLHAAEWDIVYIDGSHVCEDVRADIREAKRLVRDGGIVCGDDLELQRSEVDEGVHGPALSLNSDFVQASSESDVFYHPGVTEAVAVEFGAVSSWEGVWAMRKTGSQWTRVTMDAAGQEMPEHVPVPAVITANEIAEERPMLVDATDAFNLVQKGDTFFAVAKRLGPTHLFNEKLGERELSPLLLLGQSLEEVRRKALASEKRPTAP